MARIRTVKPELWSDEAFVECSSNARLLFVAGLNFASDYGVLPDKPKQLKMQCFPGDNVDVEPLVDELVEQRLWERRTAPDGTNVLVIRTFTSHQRVDRPSGGAFGDPKEWPDFADRSSRPLRAVDESSTTARPVRKEGKEGTLDDECSRSFDAFWAAYPLKVSKKRAQVAWRNLTKAERQAALDALPRHVARWEQTRTEPKYIKQPDGWLNGKRWEDEIGDTTPRNERTIQVGGATVSQDAWGG